jgi:hypothetical protein
MDSFVFKCPLTGMNVQHQFAEESALDGPRCTYETVLCQACSRLHFINRSSHKLLGAPKEKFGPPVSPDPSRSRRPAAR